MINEENKRHDDENEAVQTYVVSEEIIETTWECARCHAKNPGRSMRCDSCGSPKTADAAYSVSDDGPAVTDAEQLADAAAGLHWVCPYCDGQNRGNNPTCSSCGATVAENERKPAASDMAAVNGGADKAAAAPVAGAKKKSPILYILGGIVIVGVGFGLLSTRETTDNVTVQSLNWERAIIVEHKKPVVKEDWKEDLEKGARIQHCHKKATGDKISRKKLDGNGQVITEQVCEDRVENMQNGYAKKIHECKDVPVMESVDEYKDYCTYRIDEWEELQRFVNKGEGVENIEWPAEQEVISEYEKRSNKKATYNVVVVKADGQQMVFKAPTEEQYKSFEIGKSYTAVFENFGKTIKALGEQK